MTGACRSWRPHGDNAYKALSESTEGKLVHMDR